MAREIKITTSGVRNIPNALYRGEKVVAASWQDSDGAKMYAATEKDLQRLLIQSGATGENTQSINSLWQYIATNWDEQTANQAVV